MSSSTKKVTVFPKMNKVKRGVVSACPNWLDMAPLYIISLWMRRVSVIETETDLNEGLSSILTLSNIMMQL